MVTTGAESETQVRYADTGDGLRWELLGRDQRRVAASAATFPDEDAAAEAVEQVRRTAAAAAVRTFEDTTLVVHRRASEGSSWLPLADDEDVVEETGRRLVDADGDVLADLDGTSQPVGDAGESVVVVDPDDEDVRVLHGGKWVGGTDGEVLATGRVDAAQGPVGESMRVVRPDAGADAVESVRGAAFELFEDDEGYGWRLVDGAGDAVARGAERHGRLADVRAVVETVRRWADEG